MGLFPKVMQINRKSVDLYQEDVVHDLAATKAAGIDLIIHKASEGVTVWDHAYAERRSKAKAAGLLWAAYHFGRGTNVDLQIENFLIHAKPDDDTRLVLDWEVAYMSADQAREFLTKLDARMGRKTVLYSYSSFLKDQLGASRIDPVMGSHPLWIAAYTSLPFFLQPSWTKPIMWQFTDGVAGPLPHSTPGIPGAEGDVDANHWYGTDDELHSFWINKVDAFADPVVVKEPWDGLTFILSPGGDMRTAWIQDTLSMAGFGPLKVDGVSGDRTQKAIRGFQSRYRLGIDGISLLGGETEMKLKEVMEMRKNA